MLDFQVAVYVIVRVGGYLAWFACVEMSASLFDLDVLELNRSWAEIVEEEDARRRSVDVKPDEADSTGNGERKPAARRRTRKAQSPKKASSTPK